MGRVGEEELRQAEAGMTCGACQVRQVAEAPAAGMGEQVAALKAAVVAIG